MIRPDESAFPLPPPPSSLPNVQWLAYGFGPPSGPVLYVASFLQSFPMAALSPREGAYLKLRTILFERIVFNVPREVPESHVQSTITAFTVVFPR